MMKDRKFLGFLFAILFVGAGMLVWGNDVFRTRPQPNLQDQLFYYTETYLDKKGENLRYTFYVYDLKTHLTRKLFNKQFQAAKKDTEFLKPHSIQVSKQGIWIYSRDIQDEQSAKVSIFEFNGRKQKLIELPLTRLSDFEQFVISPSGTHLAYPATVEDANTKSEENTHPSRTTTRILSLTDGRTRELKADDFQYETPRARNVIPIAFGHDDETLYVTVYERKTGDLIEPEDIFEINIETGAKRKFLHAGSEELIELLRSGRPILPDVEDRIARDAVIFKGIFPSQNFALVIRGAYYLPQSLEKLDLKTGTRKEIINSSKLKIEEFSIGEHSLSRDGRKIALDKLQGPLYVIDLETGTVEEVQKQGKAEPTDSFSNFLMWGIEHQIVLKRYFKDQSHSVYLVDLQTDNKYPIFTQTTTHLPEPGKITKGDTYFYVTGIF